MLKGYKTIIWGLLLAMASPALEYLAGLDWTTIVNPTYAGLVVGAITIALRYVTNSPAPGRKKK